MKNINFKTILIILGIVVGLIALFYLTVLVKAYN